MQKGHLLPVLNFTKKDASLAIKVLEACLILDGSRDARILLASPDTEAIDAGKVAAGKAFSTVETFIYEDFSGDKRWPKPQSWGWQQVARYLETSEFAKEHCGWFWWEPDSTPIRKGWIEQIAENHMSGKTLFSGVSCLTPPDWKYMNGVGVYPFAITEPLSNVSALFNIESPFDVLAGPAVMRSFNDLSGLMLHDRKMQGGSVGKTFDLVDYELLLQKHPKAVFYHGCDETLPLLVAGKVPDKKPTEKPVVPSVMEQTPWECGMFTFPASMTPTVNYNCSVVNYRGENLLLTRRQRFYSGPEAVRINSTNANDLAIWRIRKNMTLEHVANPRPPRRYLLEQWEDPRGMVGSDGSLYVSFVTWVHSETWTFRQSLCRVRDDFSAFDVVAEPKYGGNHPDPQFATGHEKNWCWFEHDGRWKFVYTIAPDHVVVSGNTQDAISYNHVWPVGTPRGGTPPIRVGDEYLSFFHSRQPDKKWRGRYFMGAYTFSAKPPFEPRRMTNKPLLVASEADFNHLDSPLVVFPNGALLETSQVSVNHKATVPNYWLVVFGVNDEHSGWIRIPHSALEERLVRV